LYTENNPDALEERILWFREQSIKRLGQDITRFTVARLDLENAYQDRDFETAIELAESILPWYQQKNIIWRELDCLSKLLRAKKESGLDTALESERLVNLINFIEENLSEAPLQENWLRYKAQILSN
jgi:hypothetical protein